jgi:cation transport ATPase
MMGKVKFNITFSLCWNCLAVALSMLAVLGPVTGALVHNVGSVAVVVNSALLLMYGRKK